MMSSRDRRADGPAARVTTMTTDDDDDDEMDRDGDFGEHLRKFAKVRL